jgi:hypothetical protein
VNVQRGVGHGETHHLAKLDAFKVRAIRSEYAAGASLNSLSKKYGVDRTAVTLAARRKTWKSIV